MDLIKYQVKLYNSSKGNNELLIWNNVIINKFN